METPPKSVWLIATGGLCLLLLFPIAAGLLAPLSRPPVEDAERVTERSKAYQNLQSENQKKLGTYAVADAAKGTFQIPIERAMELTIPELNQHPPAPAVSPSPGASP